jgi:hypothetical protein
MVLVEVLKLEKGALVTLKVMEVLNVEEEVTVVVVEVLVLLMVLKIEQMVLVMVGMIVMETMKYWR